MPFLLLLSEGSQPATRDNYTCKRYHVPNGQSCGKLDYDRIHFAMVTGNADPLPDSPV